MSSERKIYSIGELVDVTQGLAINAKTRHLFRHSGLPLLRITDLLSGSYSQYISATDVPKQCIAAEEEVIYTRTGQVGLVFTGKVGVVHNNCFKVTPKDSRLSRRFLYWYLRQLTVYEYVNAVASGSVQKDLNHSAFKTLKIPLPSTRDQDEISAILQSIEDRITLLRKTNATLEAIAQALFKSWFVDFDPVHAKAEGRQPEGMDAATAALFPDSFEESELGLVPKGWTYKLLADAYEINPLRRLKKGELAPYLDMASVPTAGHTADRYIYRELGSGAKFINGDTLLARITPCLENGKSAFVDFLEEEKTGWGSTEFLVLRPKAPLPEYHGYLLSRYKPFREFAIQSMSGTSGRQRIQNDVLGRYALVVPDKRVGEQFSRLVSPIQKLITANHEKAQTLTQLRDTLLPRLISGQLRLPEPESLLESTL